MYSPVLICTDPVALADSRNPIENDDMYMGMYVLATVIKVSLNSENVIKVSFFSLLSIFFFTLVYIWYTHQF